MKRASPSKGTLGVIDDPAPLAARTTQTAAGRYDAYPPQPTVTRSGEVRQVSVLSLTGESGPAAPGQASPALRERHIAEVDTAYLAAQVRSITSPHPTPVSRMRSTRAT